MGNPNVGLIQLYTADPIIDMNKDEKKAYDAVYYAGNREEIRAYKAEYYVSNRREIRVQQNKSKRMQKYGMSPEAFNLMLLQQKNACGICKEGFSKAPHVDHCHVTGEVRGLLCRRCNMALGGFKDSPGILENAKAYLLG